MTAADVLPFDGEGTVTDRGGVTLATIRARVWKDRGSSNDVGQAQEFTGVVWPEDTAAQLVGQQNRLLTVEGVEYRVVDAIHYPMLGYVGVSLRQVLADG